MNLINHTTYLLVAVAAISCRAQSFNFAIGTQTFDPVYQFTTNSRLVETAEAIRDMGSSVIKFRLSHEYFGPRRNIDSRNPEIKSLSQLARDEASHRRVFDMPFSDFVIWAYTFKNHDWHRGLSPAAAKDEYREIHDLAVHFLKTYNGTGKSFFLGHWEGDWWLRGLGNVTNESKVTDAAIHGFVDWLNTRQRAIDDAKRETPHERVNIWGYTEVNLVKAAMAGRRTLCNDVIPKTQIDFVSYSSYDTQNDPVKLRAALDFIEKKLPEKKGIEGKRVFVGEYGFASIWNTPKEQDDKSRRVIRTALDWGCPFVLYWEMYNNEIDEQGKQRGFWLIDNNGAKQPVYFTHQRILAWARRFVSDFEHREKRPPTFDEYRKAAVQFIDAMP